MKTQWLSLYFFVFLALSTGCQPVQFVDINKPQEDLSIISDEFEIEFKPKTSNFETTQAEIDRNISSVSFQVKKSDSNFYGDLTADEFTLFENNQPVQNFDFSKNSTENRSIVELVIIVDVTGSMERTIEAAKARLIDFVRRSYNEKYHMRMCLVTFGDLTLKKCNFFFDLDPSNVNTEDQLKLLVSEITKLSAIKGINDPGGEDLNENSLRAVMDAASAPWGTSSQRFAILITDDGFLYSPNNQGSVGLNAPYYADVLESLKNSQMKVFAATPSRAGYNKSFSKKPGIVTYSNGEWFNYDELVKGTISLDSILNRIMIKVKTTYTATYVVSENESLDSYLPIESRNITISLNDPSIGNVEGIALTSNLPNGSPMAESRFRISNSPIDPKTLSVKINGITSRQFSLEDETTIVFANPPPPTSQIKASFELKSVYDALIFEPIRIPASIEKSKVMVWVNEIKLQPTLFNLIDVDGKFQNLQISENIISSADLYEINRLRKMKIKIQLMQK